MVITRVTGRSSSLLRCFFLSSSFFSPSPPVISVIRVFPGFSSLRANKRLFFRPFFLGARSAPGPFRSPFVSLGFFSRLSPPSWSWGLCMKAQGGGLRVMDYGRGAGCFVFLPALAGPLPQPPPPSSTVLPVVLVFPIQFGGGVRSELRVSSPL